MARVWQPLAALLLLLAASAAAASAATAPPPATWEALAGGDTQAARLPIIAVLKHHRLLRARLLPVCGGSSAAAAGELPPACAALRGACSRAFTLLPAIAGSFDRRQVPALLDCAGKGGISALVRDGQVRQLATGPGGGGARARRS